MIRSCDGYDSLANDGAGIFMRLVGAFMWKGRNGL